MNKDIVIRLENGLNKVYDSEEGAASNATIGPEPERGFLTMGIVFEFDGAGQVFGGWALGSEEEIDAPHVVALRERLCNFFNVSSLEEINGQKAIVLREERNQHIKGLMSLDGYTFFMEHWQKDFFPEYADREKSLPVRNERRPIQVRTNRLDGVE